MKQVIRGILVLVILTSSITAMAWGLTGHRVVAGIAENHLTKKAKKNIRKIIGNQSLAYWANWPDFIKSDTSWKFADSWHYVNIAGNLPKEQFLQTLETSTDVNMYKRGLLLIDQLKSKQFSLTEQQQQLYFLIHIIGDAHQPLHVGREEDLGGNRISVEWFGNKTNLHSLWDSKLVDFEQYSYTEYIKILDIHNTKYNQQLMHGSFSDWVFDSYTHANQIYGSAQSGDKLSYRYHYLYKELLETQLLKGGLRLAKVLNEIFG